MELEKLINNCNINKSRLDNYCYRSKLYYSGDSQKINNSLSVMNNNLIQLLCNFDKFSMSELLVKLRMIGIKCFERDFSKKKNLDYDYCFSKMDKNKNLVKSKLIYIINSINHYLAN